MDVTKHRTIYALTLCSLLLTITILTSLLFFSHYGIDFTDEGFYLVWMANPFIYPASISQFGFIYHPLYILLDGNITALRQANILLTFGLTWIFCSLIKPQAYLLSAGFATLSMLLFDTWLATPNYNSLAFQALVITAMGLLLDKKGGIIVGLGGALAFLAKPTTGCLLGIAVLLYLIAAKKLSMRLLLTAITSALLVLILTAFLIDGSVTAFIERLILGFEFGRYQGGGYSFYEILRIDSFKFNSRYKNLLILIIPIAAILLGYKNFSKITRPKWALAILFFFFPYIYAFGTNNNYWQTGSFAGIFWVMGGLVLLGPAHNAKGYYLAIAGQVIVLGLLIMGFQTPYRQNQPLWDNDQLIEVGRASSTLKLSKGFASYIEEAHAGAIKSGFQPGTPLIDLTGRSPTLLYILNAKNIGQAWMIGGYRGSNLLAMEALKKVSCKELSEAWLLIEPKSKRGLSVDILKSFGSNIDHYEQVATWQTAAGAGGIKEQNTQILMKPYKSIECEIKT